MALRRVNRTFHGEADESEIGFPKIRKGARESRPFPRRKEPRFTAPAADTTIARAVHRRLEAAGRPNRPWPLPRPPRRQAPSAGERNAFVLPFSPDTIRCRRAAIVDLRKLGIDVSPATVCV